MSNKSVPFSVRLAAEDAEFIASLSIPGAVTPSDKIRQIISEARLRKETGQNFNEVLKSVQEDIRPSVEYLRDLEREGDIESELLHFFADWLGETQAEFIAGPESENDLVKYEARMMQRAVKLMEYVLRLAITEDAPCFNPNLMANATRRIIELSRLIEARNQKENASV
ncbi:MULTISPECIES: hypothetical protein [Thalassospira]|uniref:hypothetical protein n=1 Tax=Thalassospira TaxID=168934 RepID=UPI0007A58907|nr:MULTISPECIES: hypothetical protein [Thalassospira]MBL4840734.1 hypothetical protein [Thalassospira sp.]MBR9779914.1 hypothetical protein [Rhodospirillales bacterium]MBR9819179.1 hypothetical protein [Rhodospirillales bacterium]MCD1593194.1 hypothetical protein [Thalassospira xiamenensis]OCK08816.1 hypothetical protein KO164_2995 [Thalassospira sp. KO164]